MSAKKIPAALFCGFLLFVFFAAAAFADVKLPEGAVKGLPEKISAVDSSGRSVSSETGEYFFYVENMDFGVVYTKDIQLMNLRDDMAYHIYFYTEPVPESKKGDIDLEKSCVCTFRLDGEQFYKGSVSGAGNIDLTKEAKDLGYYKPGDAHTLSCSVAWVDAPMDYSIDEGHRLVDKNGTVVLDPGSGKSEISGEIEFKWIFSAAADEDYVPPQTGLLAADGTFWIACIAVCTLLVVIMLVLVTIKKRKKNKL